MASSIDLEVCLSQRDNLEAIFNSVSEGIITVNQDLIIQNLNLAALKFASVSKNQATGQKYASVFYNNSGEMELRLKDILKTQNPIVDFHYTFYTPKGVKKAVIINTAILKDKEGEDKGIVIVLKDITELSSLKTQLYQHYSFSNIIGKNKKMQDIYRLIDSVADSDASTLIYGESGTGKELVAHAIHNKSRRAKGPFVKVNCSALSESLLESELFGHVKGAFTGAIIDKKGRFQLADKGTIFLDEIGEVSPAIQVKLLRVFQERVVERVGDATPISIDVRVIGATNKDLPKLVEKNIFREDLYYRLKVIALTLPPLRERKDDIMLLVDHFTAKFRQKTGKKILGIDDKVLDLFMKYSWRGNVRELENAIEHAFVLCKKDIISQAHIPIEIKEESSPLNNDEGIFTVPSKASEKEHIEKVLIKTGGNKSKAAKILGMNRTTLWRKMKQYGYEAF